jgi:RES domain-containing protein
VTRFDSAIVPELPKTSFVGQCFRQQAPKYDPLSREGARRQGGRFNPPRSYPVLYLCTTRACAVAEFLRAGTRLAIGPEGLLPRQLYMYEIGVDQVLDLADGQTLDQLGLEGTDLSSEDLSVTRSVGEAAHAFGLKAIRSRSATGQDDVLAVLVENLGLSALTAFLIETWETLADLEGQE